MTEPLTILAVDDEFVVVCKVSGFLSVPGRRPEHQDCVTNRIRTAFPGCIDHPAVHRLDMDTSGIMVVARTREAQRLLSRQFEDRLTGKRYVALIDGHLGAGGGTIELPFRLDIDNRPYQIHDPIHGKMGVTHWQRLAEEGPWTRVSFVPVTGRTHQLRVHAAHPLGLGCPIVGDPLYGTGTGPAQLRLHAEYLKFQHPVTGASLEFFEPAPF